MRKGPRPEKESEERQKGRLTVEFTSLGDGITEEKEDDKRLLKKNRESGSIQKVESLPCLMGHAPPAFCSLLGCYALCMLGCTYTRDLEEAGSNTSRSSPR